MIVNYTDSGWEVLTQRAHGIVAAQLAMHWKISERPARWTETLLAIAEHDDAEMELDGEQVLTETGGPLNFSMKKFDLAHCKKLFQFAITKSEYISLLISMHMDFLYREEIKENSIARKFLMEQETIRKQWCKNVGITKTEAEKIYALMQWCDACSLLICKREMPPEKRAIEISEGPDKKTHQLIQTGEKELTITPWPFEPDAFAIYVESRLISQLKFNNSAAFRKAFEAAPVSTKIWNCIRLR